MQNYLMQPGNFSASRKAGQFLQRRLLADFYSSIIIKCYFVSCCRKTIAFAAGQITGKETQLLIHLVAKTHFFFIFYYFFANMVARLSSQSRAPPQQS